MCGRRVAAAADRGQQRSSAIAHTLCPWLFKAAEAPKQLLEELAAHASEVDSRVGDGTTSSDRAIVPTSEPIPRAPDS